MNTTRYAVLAAGLPETVPATTVDRQCGSSQQAVHFAAQGVIAGRLRRGDRVRRGVDEPRADVVQRARGRRPVRAGRRGALPGRPGAAGDQRGADRGQVGAAALRAGPLRAGVPPARGARPPRRARSPRRSSRSTAWRPTSRSGRRRRWRRLAGLKPAFEDPAMARALPADRLARDGGQLVADQRRQRGGADHGGVESRKALGLTPKAKLRSFAVVGDDPLYMLTGVIPATAKVLEKAVARSWRTSTCSRSTRRSRRSSWPGSARRAPTWTR